MVGAIHPHFLLYLITFNLWLQLILNVAFTELPWLLVGSGILTIPIFPETHSYEQEGLGQALWRYTV